LPLAFIGGMQLINQQASVLIQGFFLPDAQIGVYRVAAQVVVLASFGLQSVNMVVAPRFATFYTQGQKEKLQYLVTNSARVILVFNLFVTAGFVVLGQKFLHVVFGDSYAAAYIPLLVMLGGQVVNSAAGSVGTLLNMTGHENYTAAGMAVAALVNIALNLLLIPDWGIVGSAWATTISLVIWNGALWWAVHKKLGINSLAFVQSKKRADTEV